MSEFLSLGRRDFVNGLVMFVGAAVFTALAQMFSVPGFQVAHMDWEMIIQIAGAAAFTYVGKNLLTTQDGKVLGMIK